MRAEYLRDIFLDHRTLGIYRLYDDNMNVLFSCFIAEDTARAAGVKIPKISAIPEGDYWLTITDSQRFGRKMPLVYNTPELEVIDGRGNKWTGIRQHIGNTEADTEGCQLMGKTRNMSGVFESHDCFEEYLKILQPIIARNGKIPLKIINQQKQAA